MLQSFPFPLLPNGRVELSKMIWTFPRKHINDMVRQQVSISISDVWMRIEGAHKRTLLKIWMLLFCRTKDGKRCMELAPNDQDM